MFGKYKNFNKSEIKCLKLKEMLPEMKLKLMLADMKPKFSAQSLYWTAGYKFMETYSDREIRWMSDEEQDRITWQYVPSIAKKRLEHVVEIFKVLRDEHGLTFEKVQENKEDFEFVQFAKRALEDTAFFDEHFAVEVVKAKWDKECKQEEQEKERE